MIKFIVVSLPRTGTSSIAYMGALCGIRSKHVSYDYLGDLAKFDLISDTPMFAPSVIEQVQSLYECKFIYCRRDWDSLYTSWVKSGMRERYDLLLKNQPQSWYEKFDYKYYSEAFDNERLTEATFKKLFRNHREAVRSAVGDSQIIEFDFQMGWEPFCDFIGKKRPDEEVPQINKDGQWQQVNDLIAAL
jgi:hypothetical protein